MFENRFQCRFKRHGLNWVDFSRIHCTLSSELREPNPPALFHKASRECVVKCVTQCAHTNFFGGVMSLKQLGIFEKLRAYDSVALTS